MNLNVGQYVSDKIRYNDISAKPYLQWYLHFSSD